MNDRDLARAHDLHYDADRHFSADPSDVLHCEHCDEELPAAPERVVTWADTASCDGEVKVAVEEYTDGLVAILGEEFRGKTYEVEFTTCGDSGPHPPHTDELSSGEDEYRTCPSCGEEDVRRLV